ncbi:thioesterase superfamily protein [Candidatus Magnetoovum chiemensis]|nr:thioesterase superfamily protein [Candidatus Magnetoovum chiemensis]
MDELEDDLHCFVCGELNPIGLNLIFKLTEESAQAVFKCDKKHQGYKDILHGGFISMILDEASVKAVSARGSKAVTAQMSVRFKNPLKVGQTALVEAKIVRHKGKLFETEAILQTQEGLIIATGNAKLIVN